MIIQKKNGNVHRYVYYRCTRARDPDCKCGAIEEKELLKQFDLLIENVNLNEIQIKEKIKEDVERFSKMQKFLVGTKEKISIPDIDIRGYAKYILKEGYDIEKRELLGCLKSKICLANKKIILMNK
jgi:hypothetical protein